MSVETDRELLEFAAKAAGYKVRWNETWQCFAHVGPHNIDNPPTPAGQRHPWTPLTDDGDALRLAVKLHIDVSFTARTVMAGEEDDLRAALEMHGQDANAATRRAIVRAAAAIGRAMP